MGTIIAVPGKVNNVRRILYWTFGLLPWFTGIDKYLILLTDGERYITSFWGIRSFSLYTFIMIAGVIEIVARIVVLIFPAL